MWWGWIIGGDTPWGSRGPSRAFPPTTTKPRSPCAACAPRKSARRTDTPKRYSQRHRDSEPGRCTNETNVPREPQQTQHVHTSQSTSARPPSSRRPRFLTAWFLFLIFLPSPGSKIRADAATFSHAQSGTSMRDDTCRFTPDNPQLDHLQLPASQLPCSEHQLASNAACDADPCPTEASSPALQENPQAQVVSSQMIPGIQISCQTGHLAHMKIPGILSNARVDCPGRNMSDMSHARQKTGHHSIPAGPPTHVTHCKKIQGIQLMCQTTRPETMKIPGIMSASCDACTGRSMSDTFHTHPSKDLLCSHVGYTSKPSRLGTSLSRPASQTPTQDSQSSKDRPEPYGCWDELYEVMRRPVLVDRHIPRGLKTLWQRLVMSLLTEEQSRTDVYPIASDLVFVLPKARAFPSPGAGES